MAEYDIRIPEKLQLLRIGLGGKDDLGIFAYYPSTQQTNFAVPSFCLAPMTDDPETMDVHGAIEQTLHDLLDYGGTTEDVRQIMGLVPLEELDDEAIESDEYIDIDLGWCIDGQLLGFERLDPEASDVRAILTDMQIAHIEEWFDVLSAENCLAKADAVAHDPSYRETAAKPDPLADLTTGKWRVHLVQEGERYGATGSLVYGDAISSGYPDAGEHYNDCQRHGHGLPLVEFYDVSQDPAKFPGGQFVSRYYMSTLLGLDDARDALTHIIGNGSSLSLDGGIPAWTVRGGDLKRVSDWLDAAHEALRGRAGEDERETPEQAVSLSGIERSSREAADVLSGRETHDGHETDAR